MADRRSRVRTPRRVLSTRPFDVVRVPAPPAMPCEVESKPGEREIPPDSHLMGIWLGERIRHFKRLTEHPLYPAIHGRLISGISSYRVAVWIQQRVDPDNTLG